MNTQRSAVSLRGIIVGTVAGAVKDSLRGINTHQFPDGALAYVTAIDAEYRLRHALSAPASPPLTEAPISGPGLWEMQGPFAQSLFACDVLGSTDFTAAGSQVVTQNVWTALQTGESFYLQPNPSSYWVADPTTGILTYSGPAGKLFSVTANFSLECDNQNTIEVDFTLNGALIGTSGSVQTSIRTTAQGSAVDDSISHARLVTPANGTTLQHCFRNVDLEPGAVHFTRYQVIIACLN